MTTTKDAKFKLGRLLITPGALAALKAAQEKPETYLHRHAAGDWGTVTVDDREENEFALKHNFRLLSAYRLSDGNRIWVITEADRQATTILLPEEY